MIYWVWLKLLQGIGPHEPGQPALSCHFPRRNALIAALSDELHVIDAGRNSGAMITAEYAKKYGKRVRKQDDPDV